LEDLYVDRVIFDLKVIGWQDWIDLGPDKDQRKVNTIRNLRVR
jgi:hypothetical protein